MTRPELAGHVVEGCRRGDPEARRLLFETYKDMVYSLALHFTGDETQAGDLTQEVFLKLFTRIVQFRGDASFTTWLYRLVVNQCLDERKKQRRLVRIEDESSLKNLVAESSQEADYLRNQITVAVRDALRHLKPKLRLPLLLRYVEGLSYAEIGVALGCSTAAVASRLNRAHKILGRKLTPLRGMVS